MNKILMLKGLPASGKSTFARKLVAGDIRDMGNNWKRVNKDELRSMLDDGYWSKQNEKFVIDVRDGIIEAALRLHQSVVVDDTNFSPGHEAYLRDVATAFKIPFEVKFFDETPEVCIERDLKRANSVGSKVIMQMYNQYLKPAPEVYVPPEGKPTAILCDIDGTLAHGIGVTRKPYEWDKVSTDTLDVAVADVIASYDGDPDYKVILMSGRDSVCRADTEKWLADHMVAYDELFMRAEGDSRKDYIVKRELFDNHIRDNYDVLYVLDDRNQVVDMWRQMGLKVFQVEEGDF